MAMVPAGAAPRHALDRPLTTAIVVGFIVSSLAVAPRRAEDADDPLRENLYAADMGVAFHALDGGNVARAREAGRQPPSQGGRAGPADVRMALSLSDLTRPRELLTLEWSGSDPTLGIRHCTERSADCRLVEETAGLYCGGPARFQVTLPPPP